MPNIRYDRINEEVKKTISEIVRESNGAPAAYLERVPHAYAAQLNFLEHGLEQALHGILYILYRIIDYAVKSYIHVFLFGQGPCAGVGAHVEADNDCVGRGCKYNVGVGYSADCAMDAPSTIFPRAIQYCAMDAPYAHFIV